MRLSRAILVMLLLHVVAVGGILAFSLIKERGSEATPPTRPSSAVEAEDSDRRTGEGRRPRQLTAPARRHSRDTWRTRVPTHSGEPLTRVVNDPITANRHAQRRERRRRAHRRRPPERRKFT